MSDGDLEDVKRGIVLTPLRLFRAAAFDAGVRGIHSVTWFRDEDDALLRGGVAARLLML